MGTPSSWWDIRHLITLQMFQLKFLVTKLDSLIGDEVVRLRDELTDLKNSPLYNQNIGEKHGFEEGKVTKEQVKKLKKDNFELYQNISQETEISFRESEIQLNIQLLSESFPALAWSSIAIIVMAKFEEYLVQLCDYLCFEKGLETSIFNFENYNSDILEGSKFFLKEVALLDISFGELDCWAKLNSHKKIRNHLVHNHGTYRRMKEIEKIKNQIEQFNFPISLNHSVLNISKDYVLIMIKDIQYYFEHLFKVIDEQLFLA